MQDTHPTQASSVVRDLDEGDVVEIDHYENALEVTFTGELGGEQAMIGLDFAENPTGAEKSLIVNKHSGRVYLTRGAEDLGEVETIDVRGA